MLSYFVAGKSYERISMSRSLKKGPFVDRTLINKLKIGKKITTTQSRATMIIPPIIGKTFLVHNGRISIKVFITDQIVGHKLGEFSYTRIFRGHFKSAKKAKRR